MRGRWAGERWALVNSAKEELATREVIWEDNLFNVNVKVLPPSLAIVKRSLLPIALSTPLGIVPYLLHLWYVIFSWLSVTHISTFFFSLNICKGTLLSCSIAWLCRRSHSLKKSRRWQLGGWNFFVGPCFYRRRKGLPNFKNSIHVEPVWVQSMYDKLCVPCWQHVCIRPFTTVASIQNCGDTFIPPKQWAKFSEFLFLRRALITKYSPFFQLSKKLQTLAKQKVAALSLWVGWWIFLLLMK